MKTLAADLTPETFSTQKRKSDLRVENNPDFAELLEGLDTGDVDVYFEARKETSKVSFSSKSRADQRWVEDYGADLEYGMEVMLRALGEYEMERAGGQGGFKV